jgi:5-oxoprolinase (ATP-hydrolysing)
MPAGTGSWEFWIDRGGTFTDIIGRTPKGDLVTLKLLSENPERYADAASAGMETLMERHGEAHVAAVRMGTTVGTNALLERKGEPTVLAITAGHKDALRIGTQNRPNLFALEIVLPELLYSRAIEIGERVTAAGEIIRPLEEEDARAALEDAFDQGYRALAIALMHSYRYPAHEKRLAEIAREIGFTQISASHEVSGLIKLIGRGDTAVADAYLSPVLRRHIDRTRARLKQRKRLFFMQSSGGLAEADAFRGKDAILSGPAGGVVGMASTARAAGFDRVIGFDMGGTSTDVSHFAGRYERTHETTIAGVRLRMPMLDIRTVAAGGGSICRFDGMRLRVGPESAGAVPGPACYRRGGPLTVTDCNLMLGRLQPELFPHVFGARGNEPIDREIVVERFKALAAEIAESAGKPAAPEDIAEGCLVIAVENMARAIRQVSIERGHDVTGYVLNAFGGAAGQHACMVADRLGIGRVMIHPLAGLLSAYGIGLAEMSLLRQQTVNIALDGAETRLRETADVLASNARRALEAQGAASDRIETVPTVELRYEGVDATLTVALAAPDDMRAAFETLHRARFGFINEDKRIVADTVSVEAIGRTGRLHPDPPSAASGGTAPVNRGGKGTPQPLSSPARGEGVEHSETEGGAGPIAMVRARMAGQEHNTLLYDRGALAPGASVSGPAIIQETNATTIVEPGWRALVDPQRNLILERVEPLPTRQAVGTDVDPVMLEVFNNLFMAIAEEMGLALQNTASSVNIKERLDFSCALFDVTGALIANAPHIPVHLGSMGDSVRTIIEARGDAKDGRGIRPGDVYVLNAPYHGGSHLPDVTVVMPAFDAEGELVAFVASRGHHADIGGITPGSMPPFSRVVEEEGVLIDNFLLVDEGSFRETETIELLASGPYPARNPRQNIADLKAQVAACVKGTTELRALIAAYSRSTVHAYMRHVQDNAAECVRRVIDRLDDGAFACEMDNGAVVKVAITVDRAARTARVDFSGTSAQLANNFNAPLSVCRAAVLYVFRTLVEDEIPLNDGCMRPITMIVPEGSMLNPRYPAAVVAGNVETSQAITDALYGALGVEAAAQGTMNNFTFGDGDVQYYETVCGGSGAGDGFNGANAVHTHMTNTRLADPEILESRFPVLLEEFSIRQGSGGRGMFEGGNGAVRKIRFLKPMSAAILSNRRRVAPFGLNGGGDAAPGHNYILRTDGAVETLMATGVAEMRTGDVFVIETPGGGAFGAPETD